MGKSYELELSCLNQTYRWALEAPIEELSSFVGASLNSNLVAIGSGGSLTAAKMAAILHQKVGAISKGITPLEFVHLGKAALDSSVLILTSKGNNSDVLSVFRQAANIEPRRLVVMCMKKHSPLSHLSQEFRYARFIDYELPSREDGFLATNSLLASVILLIRAYTSLCPESDILSKDPPSVDMHHFEGYTNLLNKKTIVVLYDYWGLPAAVDIESKFTEAALGNIQIADYRNFGHGRHHWLAKRGTETGIIALQTPEDSDIADKTLNLLPSEIPSFKISTKLTGPAGSLDLLLNTMYLANLAGKNIGINPGGPGVPQFGRRIYHLSLPRQSRFKGATRQIRQVEAAAILRKSRKFSLMDMEEREVDYWHNAYQAFARSLEEARFGGLVLDYDGTLCDSEERYNGPSANIISELVRLLEEGLIIGIATGRGGSVRRDLRRLINERYWERVLVGYYSGSDIALLDDDQHPDKTLAMHPALDVIKIMIHTHARLSSLAKFEYRPNQISVEATKLSFWLETQVIVKDIVAACNAQVRILESDHSLDVVAPGVSKLDIISACQRMTRFKSGMEHILCIGDKGEWPGNDYELLTSTYSLSVDTVSPNPKSCWNLARPGHRGTQATIEYLTCTKVIQGEGHFHVR